MITNYWVTETGTSCTLQMTDQVFQIFPGSNEFYLYNSVRLQNSSFRFIEMVSALHTFLHPPQLLFLKAKCIHKNYKKIKKLKMVTVSYSGLLQGSQHLSPCTDLAIQLLLRYYRHKLILTITRHRRLRNEERRICSFLERRQS